jgi:hypothetical protein
VERLLSSVVLTVPFVILVNFELTEIWLSHPALPAGQQMTDDCSRGADY